MSRWQLQRNRLGQQRWLLTAYNDTAHLHRDCGLVVAVPVGRWSRYELADPRLAHALHDLRTAVVAVDDDRRCPDIDSECC